MDYNSRYKAGGDSMNTIRTNTGGYNGLDDMDIMEQESAQKKNQVRRASQARGGSGRGRKSKRQMLVYAIIIAVEVLALIVIWSMYFSYNSGSKPKKESKKKTEAQGENNGINVDNDNFSLTCSKVSITMDAAGNPAAVFYFTFVNKTDAELSMSQVFAPSFNQAGADLSTEIALAETPQEIGNKDVPVSGGQSIDCAYAAALVDTTSEITITMHDNYETFSDIGSVVLPIS